MNRMTVYVLISIIILAVSVGLPLHRGRKLNCDDGVYTRMAEMGLPFGFYETTGNRDMICIDQSASWDTDAPIYTSLLKLQPLLYDLLIDVVTISGAYFLFKPSKVAK